MFATHSSILLRAFSLRRSRRIYEWIVCGSTFLEGCPLLISHDAGKCELSYYLAEPKLGPIRCINTDDAHAYGRLHRMNHLETLFWLRSRIRTTFLFERPIVFRMCKSVLISSALCGLGTNPKQIILEHKVDFKPQHSKHVRARYG